MGKVYGNVKVNYAPCKSVGQLKGATDYILGNMEQQRKEGIIKTRDDLYMAFGCNRDNFANTQLITRKMHEKKYSRWLPKEILAHKMSISFHPEDNNKVTYEDAFEMAQEFAREFFWSKDYEVLFAVHTDTVHIHVHFIVSNCNLKDGSSYRRGPKELREMCVFFGEQCRKRGLTHSYRDTFYVADKERERKTFPEYQMKKRDKLSFKDELRTYIKLAMNSRNTKTLEDVVEELNSIYRINVRLKGKTISYALPHRPGKGGKLQAVRGSKLGDKFTVAGITEYMEKKEMKRLEYERLDAEIEKANDSINDYDQWEEWKNGSSTEQIEEVLPDKDTYNERKKDISFYEGFDQFREEHQIPEADDEIFYGAAFEDFNGEWQGNNGNGTDFIKEEEKTADEQSFPSPSDYRKLSLEERTKLLPPPSDDQMTELKAYQKRMGYDENLSGIKYKMSVFDDFQKEFEYRKKAAPHEEIKTPIRRRGRGR
ncbi:MAG: relaxase/mobilization nuclease domain-containing protein [Lachnospira sp.]|nr:relaxase/mobilization nuclease domain-containing protein [Lachnospira sp.]